MGTTSDFIKLRSSKTPKVGEWNIDYKTALAQAKKQYKFIVTAWSNGDACGYCVAAEKCMLTDVFKKWMQKADAYFVFQYSGDKDKGKDIHDWIYKGTGLKYYPGFRVTLYDAAGKIVIDKAIEGNKLRNSKTGNSGATEMINTLNSIFSKKPAKDDDTKTDDQPAKNYVTRLNEKLTVKKINAILDAIDKNNGYCPCQPKSEGSKCHCEDYVKNKAIGVPCICNIYVKKAK